MQFKHLARGFETCVSCQRSVIVRIILGIIIRDIIDLSLYHTAIFLFLQHCLLHIKLGLRFASLASLGRGHSEWNWSL